MAAIKKYHHSILTRNIVIVFALLTIAIACLGLFGLATFTAEARTKEIGIRKVLGASVLNLVNLLSQDFIKLVLVALVVASPIAYYAMTRFLESYVYRVSIDWPVFVVSAILAIAIALITVSYQAIKAALMNPAKSLNTE